MCNTTIIYRGVEFDVEFDYQPYEPMVMYYKDGSGYPGCAEEAQVTNITCKGVDFYEFFFGYGTDNERTELAHEFERLILEARAESYDPDYGMDMRGDR